LSRGDLHKIFSDKETIDKVYAGCRSAGIGCMNVKSWAADHLVKDIAPMQERRRKYEQNPKLAWDIDLKRATPRRALCRKTRWKKSGRYGTIASLRAATPQCPRIGQGMGAILNFLVTLCTLRLVVQGFELVQVLILEKRKTRN